MPVLNKMSHTSLSCGVGWGGVVIIVPEHKNQEDILGVAQLNGSSELPSAVFHSYNI